ncbi:MAG: hypothetical protein A3I68_05600 [Candidatus Melainabacteria bacterium RIFCSPLOWO2_02_FULL_35_15]|nr:MAG: hypothetical protein A3F80_06080 [Candidatus Melainabacteria bacterium RIFCSPLOWO2_12_FULL_35_11]OGI13336.1 MAG: hypothetical protein A3I68_05600 [Candidatus Melainabacteria bacterium RIFCSPLOWO2_02_FULL_35_15]
MPIIRRVSEVDGARTKGGIIVPLNSPLSASVTVPNSIATDATEDFSAGFLARAEANKAKFMAEKPWMQFLSEYIPAVEQNPKKYLRQVARYFLDAVEYWDRVCGVEPDKKIKVMGKWVHPYAFTSKPWEPKGLVDKELVQDQLIFWNDLMEQIKVMSRKKHPNKMIVIHGPNATGKSLAFDTMFGMLEAYSKTDEGALYTYEWVFGNVPGDNMGFHSSMKDFKKLEGILTRDDIQESFLAGKNASPIFLLSKIERENLLTKLNAEGKIPEDLNTDYILSSEVNDASRITYEVLKNIYEGDDAKVLNHVHVVRWHYSAQGRRGLVLIQPNVTPNTRLVEVLPRTDLEGLPRPLAIAFRNAGIHLIEGDEAEANHGVIVYDDFLKDAVQGEHIGSMDEFLHLLRFAEKGKTTISTTTTKGRGAHAVDEGFDVLMCGTTNDDTLMLLEDNYSEWPSLNARFLKVAMWMSRNYRPVTEIFRPQLLQLLPPKGTRHVSPNALEAFGLWVTMTYLFPAQNTNYYNSLPHIDDKVKPRLTGLLSSGRLSALEKALLYQHEDINSYRLSTDGGRYSQEDQQMLESVVDAIANEYNLGVGRHKFFFYEGSVGFDVRQAEPILQRAIMAKSDECFSIIEIFDILGDEIKHGFEFEKKRDAIIKNVGEKLNKIRKENMKSGGATTGLDLTVLPEKIPSTRELLDQVKEHEKRRIKLDVYQALNCIKPKEEQVLDLKKYVEHIMASIGRRQLRSQWRSAEGSTQPDENFMQKMEKILSPSNGFSDSDKRTEFRRNVAGSIGTWAIDNTDKDAIEHLDKIDVMKDFIRRMIDYDITKSEEKVKFFLQDLRTYYERGKDMKTHSLAKIEPERVSTLHGALNNLKQKGYCDKCITKHIFFAFPDS